MGHKKTFTIACLFTSIFPALLLSPVLSDIGLCIIAVCFLLHCYQTQNWSWCRESWVRILLLLWLYMIGRGLCAPDPKAALASSMPFIRYIVFAVALARWTLENGPTHQKFLYVLCGVVIACAIDGLVQYIFGYDIMLHKLIHDPNVGHIRLSGPFSRPILGIMLTWLAFPALLPLLFDSKAKPQWNKKGGGAIIGLLIVITAIALSGERMALLLTLLGSFIAACILPLSKRLLCVGAAIILLLLTGLTWVAPEMFERQVTSTIQTVSHWEQSPYGLLLRSDLTLATEHPLIGLGADHFRASCEALYAGDKPRIDAMCNIHPHNIYLEWLIEEGCIGLGLFIFFVAIVLRDSIAVLYQNRGNPIFVGWFIAFVLRVWPFMSTTGFFSRWGAPPFWLAVGALLVYTAAKGEKNAGASLSFQDTGL